MPFCWIRAFLIYKGKGKEDGVEGGGGVRVNGQVNMSLSHLRDEVFFSLGLKCHSEATLHYGVSSLAEANVQ